MNKTPESKQFWRLCGPVLLYWAVQFAARFVVELIVMLPHIPGIIDYEAIASTQMTQDKVLEMAMQNAEELMKILQKYSVEILGAAALFTIPLTLTLIWMDKKRDQKEGIVQAQKAALWTYTGILAFGAAFCVGMNALLVMTNLAFESSTYQETSEVLYSASLPVQIVCLGLIIPITEELMYRGVLFRRYREGSGFMRAAIGSSLLFGVMHGNIIQMVYGFILGMFLAFIYNKYGSLKAPILLHVTVNLISLFLTEAGILTWLAANPIRMGVATIISAFACSVVFVVMQRVPQNNSK